VRLSRLLDFLYLDLLLPGIRKTQSRRYRRLARNVNLLVRRYRPGDERGIIRLFHMTFRKRKSSSRWRWEFLENPYGIANIALLDSDKTGIVGHYGGILVRFNVRGEVIPVAQSVDVMIHPAFRGRATLERLVRAYLEISRANGVKFIYGFNESVVARSNRRFFGGELAAVSEWVHELSGRAVREPADEDPAVGSVTRFDAEADALWERVKGRYPCAAVRDSDYLNWRYSRRSDRDYVLCQATDPSSRGVVALAVFAASGSDGLILELLSDTDESSARAVSALLRASIVHFSRTGKLRVRAWLPVQGRLRECMQAMGFRPLNSGFYLNLFGLDDSIHATALKDEFYYTLGDYDVY
jgi:hypothetical protein